MSIQKSCYPTSQFEPLTCYFQSCTHSNTKTENMNVCHTDVRAEPVKVSDRPTRAFAQFRTTKPFACHAAGVTAEAGSDAWKALWTLQLKLSDDSSTFICLQLQVKERADANLAYYLFSFSAYRAIRVVWPNSTPLDGKQAHNADRSSHLLGLM